MPELDSLILSVGGWVLPSAAMFVILRGTKIMVVSSYIIHIGKFKDLYYFQFICLVGRLEWSCALLCI